MNRGTLQTMSDKNTDNKIARPPIVAVMGHIDHGKSTLLDYIRGANIVAGEAGGITQHLGAYEIERSGPDGDKRRITFLDTPGHEAFDKIRERSAAISDIAILIVSAEDGVKAQTVEALKQITDAGIPYVVAINKIDRPNANIERTKQSLAENNIFVEGWGGDVPVANISAKTGEGVDDLLDVVILATDLEDLSGNTSVPAEGFVIEANLDKKTGITVTLVIKNGTLKTGDFIVAGGEMAKIKKLEDFQGKTVKELTFSSPAKVLGFTEVPSVGSPFYTFDNKKEAEEFAEKEKAIKSGAGTAGPGDFDSGKYLIPILAKADVSGSLDAVKKEIGKIKTDENYSLKVVSEGLGQITENDVKLVAGTDSKAIILGFNVKADRAAMELAERFGVTIATFDIIYKMSEWFAEEIERIRPRVKTEQIIGQAKVIKVFSQTKTKQVLGGQVTEGRLEKGSVVNIKRRDTVIGTGKITDLEQARTKTPSVESPEKFGAMVETKNEIAEGDVLEATIMVTK